MSYPEYSTSSASEIVSQISVMRRQEETTYQKFDALRCLSDERMIADSEPAHIDVDNECRDKMASWCFDVVQYCKMNSETVEIALSYLDRFLVTKNGRNVLKDRSDYQLSCMAALYTAIKIHEPLVIDPRAVSNMSQGAYKPYEIEAMESEILGALQWYLNPPTSLSFVRLFLLLIPDTIMDEHSKNTVYDLTKLQIDTAMRMHTFAAINASTLAYCALINSVESVGIEESWKEGIKAFLLKSIIGSDEAKISAFNNESPCIQRSLYELFCSAHAVADNSSSHDKMSRSSSTASLTSPLE